MQPVARIILSFLLGLTLFCWGIISWEIYSDSRKKLKAAKERVKKDSMEDVFLGYCLDNRVVDITKSVVIILVAIAIWATFIFM